MKKIFIGLMMMTGISLSAQTLSNPGFENWTTGSSYAPDTVPNNWYAMFCYTAHQTTDAYQGTYATRLQGYFACGIAPGILVNGTQPAGYGNIIEGGTPFNSRPAAISGYYKYTEVAEGDSAEVTVILKKFNHFTMRHDTIGLGIQPLAAAAAYTMFTVNMNYFHPTESPDSIIIMFNSSKHYMWDQVTMALPSLYIDRIILPQVSIAGVDENNNALLTSVVYPNPSNGNLTIEIKGDLSSFKKLQLTVFDVKGEKVTGKRITENITGMDGLAAGQYIYRISDADTLLSTGKMTVQ
jgi:hypothetical protein